MGQGPQMSPGDSPGPQRFYHGTRAALKRGDLIEEMSRGLALSLNRASA